ncbi:MAG: transcription antitermination factor NusB [Streptococcaceae bacterium]|jgi:N utilization substance protein B|nr:transcription antitermination factor NusB [Streptococcaceae bacterium]
MPIERDFPVYSKLTGKEIVDMPEKRKRRKVAVSEESSALTAVKPVKVTQHKLRQLALQTLFVMTLQPDTPKERALAFALDGAALSNPELTEALVEGVLENLSALDAQISDSLSENWTLARLTTVDKTILRLGVYEVTKMETPSKVALDEAINLAHDFSDDAAATLINGVLNQFL